MRAGPEPAPPTAVGTGLPWDVPVEDAVAAIAAARQRHGDEFVVESGTDRYLFTFSPGGVDAFYRLPEERASKGVADFLMLRRKLPEEIFDGRRTLPGALFRRDDVASYLANLEEALDLTVAELGTAGSVDVFGLARRLAHRMGLASWAGPGAADGPTFERLVRAFDTLDGAEAFVHPDRMAAVAASGGAAERAALADIVDVVAARVRVEDHGLFSRIAAEWAGAEPGIASRGIAYDVALIHVASMSNLAAALGWTLVDLLAHPAEAARVRAGDQDLARRAALESTRLAQRSIMSRAVLAPVDLATGEVTYRVPPGWTIATLLPLLNTSAAPGLQRWDPDRWTGHRLAGHAGLAAPVLVTAFGHGRHTCPAQSFSLAAMTTAATRLLIEFDLTPRWSGHPRPVQAQIGGVARAAEPCPANYVRIEPAGRATEVTVAP
ncbi:cytochrome [Mycobacterium sp. NPDC050041]|uniref:cytochrome n=1 Tax=Mycobacterium sp. NPDC050041 TaxID=3364293 RepID=UPI003C2F9DCD